MGRGRRGARERGEEGKGEVGAQVGSVSGGGGVEVLVRGERSSAEGFGLGVVEIGGVGVEGRFDLFRGLKREVRRRRKPILVLVGGGFASEEG